MKVTNTTVNTTSRVWNLFDLRQLLDVLLVSIIVKLKLFSKHRDRWPVNHYLFILVSRIGPREQLNQASSYLDASMIYGNTISLSDKLRTFEGGRLTTAYTKDGRELLPFSKDPVDGCNQEEEIKKGRYCFLSGNYLRCLVNGR